MFVVRMENTEGKKGYFHYRNPDGDYCFLQQKQNSFHYPSRDMAQTMVNAMAREMGKTEEEAEFNDFPIWVEEI